MFDAKPRALNNRFSTKNFQISDNSNHPLYRYNGKGINLTYIVYQILGAACKPKLAIPKTVYIKSFY